MVNLGYLAARFEDVQLAPHLLTLLEPYDGRFFQAITTHHVTEHYRGLLAATAGRHQEAADSLRRAVDAQDAAGAPILAAESRLEWARLSLLDGEWSGPQPTALLDTAISVADDCGASALAKRAVELRSRV